MGEDKIAKHGSCVASMTGFSAVSRHDKDYEWTWELKCLNGGAWIPAAGCLAGWTLSRLRLALSSQIDFLVVFIYDSAPHSTR